MQGQHLSQYLRKNHINYEFIRHPTAYTAQGIAHSAHISGKMFAKTVIIKINEKIVMMVIPANKKLNLELLKGIFWTNDIKLASENEFKDIFFDCETGGMPPFGNLYGLKVYVSTELTRDETIIFNAGNHSDLIKLLYTDYAKLVHPNVLEFTAE